MATRTAVASGPWSSAGTWDTGVPVNSDTAVIPLAYDVEFDADQSGFANGVTVTLNGTLHASTTAGSYVLKLAANMTGSGTLRAGTSGTPYPTNCTFTINRNGFQITATSMTLDLNCSEPTVKYCKLSGVEAAGQTILSVDTDLTGYTSHWVAGATVRIDDANGGNESEERVIAVGGIAASTITITSGLTAQKEIGAHVVLISRNVKITHTSNTGNAIDAGSGTGGGRIYAEFQGFSTGVINANNMTIGGTLSDGTSAIGTGNGNQVYSVFSGLTNGISGGTGYTIRDLISGCNSGINAGAGHTVLSTCTISGCASGVNVGGGHIFVGASIKGCARGINGGSGFSFIGVTFSNNTQDLDGVPFFNAYNATFDSSTEFTNYNGAARPINAFAESINHDAQAGAYKAWARGGIVTKQASVYPTGYTSSQLHACESATYPVFQNYSVTVPAGGGLVVQTEITKDTAMSYLPRVWILLPGIEPLISGSASYEGIITTDMTSTSTWETVTLVYANSTTAPVTVTVRTLAKNATGNVYFYPVISVLSPATYDVYSTQLGYLTNIQSRLPATLVSGRMDSYAGAIAAGVVSSIQSGLSTLTAQQVWEYVTRTLTASSDPTAAAIVAQILATTVEGRSIQNILLDVWAQVVGDSSADDADEPGTITYDSPDGTVQVTHTLTDTTRSWS